LGWTPGCPSVPHIPVEEPGHAGDARKAPGPWRGAPRHRGHVPGPRLPVRQFGVGVDSVTDGFGHDSVTDGFGHDSTTPG